jgi:hypothetical protein
VADAKAALAGGLEVKDSELAKLLLTSVVFASDYEEGTFWTNLYEALGAAISGDPKPQFATGGLANFTGPAWLDGTPSRPEYVLSAAQTERFFSLVDILEEYDKGTGMMPANTISVDVDINVESLSSDYDVEQVANKIRSMLYNDAMYRNVNNINLIR